MDYKRQGDMELPEGNLMNTEAKGAKDLQSTIQNRKPFAGDTVLQVEDTNFASDMTNIESVNKNPPKVNYCAQKFLQDIKIKSEQELNAQKPDDMTKMPENAKDMGGEGASGDANDNAIETGEQTKKGINDSSKEFHKKFDAGIKLSFKLFMDKSQVDQASTSSLVERAFCDAGDAAAVLFTFVFEIAITTAKGIINTIRDVVMDCVETVTRILKEKFGKLYEEIKSFINEKTKEEDINYDNDRKRVNSLNESIKWENNDANTKLKNKNLTQKGIDEIINKRNTRVQQLNNQIDKIETTIVSVRFWQLWDDTLKWFTETFNRIKLFGKHYYPLKSMDFRFYEGVFYLIISVPVLKILLSLFRDILYNLNS